MFVIEFDGMLYGPFILPEEAQEWTSYRAFLPSDVAIRQIKLPVWERPANLAEFDE